jgi:hypothetical protein
MKDDKIVTLCQPRHLSRIAHARSRDSEIQSPCREITPGQRTEIDQMKAIPSRLK